MSREFSPAPSDKNLSSNTLVLQALAIAAVVLGLEFLAIGLGSLYSGDWRIWGGLSAVQLFSDDAWSHVQQNPGGVIWVAAVEYFAHLLLCVVLGFLNPIGRIVSNRLTNENLNPENPYIVAIEGAREALGADETVAIIRLLDGSTYTGSILSVSFEPRADGSRDLFLQNVQRLGEAGQWEPVSTGDGASGLLLGSERILAIELSYVSATAVDTKPAVSP